MKYPISALQLIAEFLRRRHGESWCNDCLERQIGRSVHTAPVQLEGSPGFRRVDAACVGCGKIRLILRYVA
jgi:hypothetical protein